MTLLLRRNAFLVIAVVWLCAPAEAKPWWLHGIPSNESDFLPPDTAFRIAAHDDGKAVRVRWAIADGYYLYRQRMEIKAESPGLALADPVFPAGKSKTDPYLGTQEIFVQQVEASAAYTRADGGAHPLQIKVTYQGCAEAGLCYPPITKVLFPQGAAPVAAVPSHGWEGVAIIGGALAFLWAGALLRKGRSLDLPAP